MAAKKSKEAQQTAIKNEAETEAQRQKDEALFNSQYYQDMTERTEVKNMLRKLREQQDAQRSQNEARNAVLGATTEQQIAQQDSLNKSYADSLADITRNASTLRDGYLQNYQNNLHNYYTQRMKNNTDLANMQKDASNQWGQASSNAFQAAGSFAGIAAGAGMPRKHIDPIQTPTQSLDVKNPPTTLDAEVQKMNDYLHNINWK